MNPRWKPAWLLAITALAGGLAWLAARDIAWSGMLEAMEGLDLRLIALAVAAVVGAGALEALRWKLLLHSEPVSLGRLFLVRNVGQGLNNLSPVRVVAEVSQAALLIGRDGLGAPKVISSIVLGRLLDWLTSLSLVGAGLLLLPQLAGFKHVVAPLWAALFAALLAVILMRERLTRIPGLARVRPLERVLRSMGAAGARQATILACVALTGGSMFCIGAAAWLVAQGAGIHLPFWVISVIAAGVGLFSSTVPGPPGMVGVYEFAAVSTLSLFAVHPSAALTFALVTHAVLLLPPLAIGIPTLALEWRLGRRPPPLWSSP